MVKQNVKTARGRKVSSTRWIHRHINDPYVLASKKEGYRSRAAMKLMELEDRYHLITRAKSCIVDLGSAPGGWLQVACKKKKKHVTLVGLDLKEIESVSGAFFVQGDFCDDSVVQKVLSLSEGKIDLVMSDMAPSTSGDKMTDHLRIMGLLESVADFAAQHLSDGGSLIVKTFVGKHHQDFIKMLRKRFDKVILFKPGASYKDSSEMFIVSLGKKV